jgi:hypothetical protein
MVIKPSGDLEFEMVEGAAMLNVDALDKNHKSTVVNTVVTGASQMQFGYLTSSGRYVGPTPPGTLLARFSEIVDLACQTHCDMADSELARAQRDFRESTRDAAAVKAVERAVEQNTATRRCLSDTAQSLKADAAEYIRANGTAKSGLILRVVLRSAILFGWNVDSLDLCPLANALPLVTFFGALVAESKDDQKAAVSRGDAVKFSKAGLEAIVKTERGEAYFRRLRDGAVAHLTREFGAATLHINIADHALSKAMNGTVLQVGHLKGSLWEDLVWN